MTAGVVTKKDGGGGGGGAVNAGERLKRKLILIGQYKTRFVVRKDVRSAVKSMALVCVFLNKK